MVIKRVVVIILATVALATPVLSFAQSERGSITGVVQDASRAGIPGVSVKVINTATNAATTVVSSESGIYSAANLPPGTYRIQATLQGFRSANVDGIRLAAGATARIDVNLASEIPFRATGFPPTGSVPSRGNTSRWRDRRSSRIVRGSCRGRWAMSRTTMSLPVGPPWKRLTNTA